MKKRVICAGVHRSGSTWLFNAARIILLENNQNVYSCWEQDYDLTNSADYHVIKTHRFKHFLSEKTLVFTTIRDLRDIAASAVRRNLVNNNKKEIIEYLKKLIKKEYNPWKKHSNLEIKYEDLYGNKIKYIEKISNIINQKCDANKIHKKIESLPLKKVFDPISLLHPNHITNGGIKTYSQTLNNDTIKQIEEIFFKFYEDY